MLDTIKGWINSPKNTDADLPLPLEHDLRGYRIDRVIHRGGMSWVYKAWDPKGKPVVIKEFFPHSSAKRVDFDVVSKPNKETFFREAFRRFHEEGRFMGMFRGNTLPRIRTFFHFNGTAYIVLEWERGRTLGSYIRVPRKQWASWDMVRPFAQDIFLTMCKLHQANVLHLDIHPANIFLNLQGRAILLDFGAARHAAEPVINGSRFFTPGYSAPEIKTDSLWGPWTDIYSFGCCLRSMGALRPENNYPDEVVAMVKGCLVDDPKLRIRSLDDERVQRVFNDPGEHIK